MAQRGKGRWTLQQKEVATHYLSLSTHLSRTNNNDWI